ncbi:MAG: tripartite tricarboxylate transporter substrate binding protein [Betaproteobacteria bacterium]|nr:tripartite tricarboxylate transporter substrate binding protein [Betaproteobacteria bacterium]
MKPFYASLLALLVLVAGFAPSAGAQPYPARPIRFVVPFPPGGGVDIVARSIGEKLSQRLGQPLVIDNKPGAGTTIGTDAAAKSAPDGYTFLIGPIGGQAIVLLMHKKLSFDIRRDFAPVTRIGYGTVALIVPAASKAKSVADLVALAKASPGKMTYASSGVGALIHLTGEMFTQAAGVTMTHVPYKGTTQILPDLLDGRVDMALDSLPAYLPHLKSGKVRALAVAARKRSAQLPEQPTLIESGLVGVVSATDYALFAPARTPPEVIALINRETNAVLQMPDVRTKLLAQGIELSGSTPEALKDELLDEIAKWAKVIQQGNIRVD